MGDSPQTVRHSHELYEAIDCAFKSKQRCHLVLVKGTMYGTSKGGIKAAIDGNYWGVREFYGSVEDGFKFVLERVK